jgi:protein-L-isoaspartate(D-aspartate) O-methyltransferase
MSTPVPPLPPTFDGKRSIPSETVTRVMLDLLDLKPEDILLEIGTGSGYQTKAFAWTGATVFSIELEPWIDPTKTVGDYVYLYAGDGFRGLPEHSPFSAIVATCGVEQIPQAWLDQLADGGRLVVPIGDSSCQRLTLFRKLKTDLVPERIGAYTRFQMLREPPKPRAPKYQPQGASE